jgi:hypothetical protein
MRSLVIPGRGGEPESIAPADGYGFQARRFAAPGMTRHMVRISKSLNSWVASTKANESTAEVINNLPHSARSFDPFSLAEAGD